MISIATWNVNSIRQRIVHLLNFLQDHKIDICLLQELKCTNEAFPINVIEEIGYNNCIYR